jgi:hypothetical protein
MVTGAPYYHPETGARLISYWQGTSFRFTIDAQSGSGHFSLNLPQAWRLAQTIVNVTANPGIGFDQTQLEFGVPANFFGPPVMHVAGIKTKGQAALTPSKEQQAAVDHLRKNGFEDMAGLLEVALRHECFLAIRHRRKEIRAKLKKIKPGTIYERKKGAAALMDKDGNEFLIEIKDPTRSVLSVIK